MGLELSHTDHGILEGIKRSQHAYCADLARLSVADLAVAYEYGVLDGDEKLPEPGYGKPTQP